mmetsp:Transcript_60268/g.143632  ORF Transcript_60268/g.143632 Transcript_60268/m.143632 type:complete len:323 (+) Transcript_60268:63-1031(+)
MALGSVSSFRWQVLLLSVFQLLPLCNGVCPAMDPLPSNFKVIRDYWSFYSRYDVEGDNETLLAEVETSNDKKKLDLQDASGSVVASMEQQTGKSEYTVTDCEGVTLAVLKRKQGPLDQKLEIMDAAGANTIAETSGFDLAACWNPFWGKDISVTLTQPGSVSAFAVMKRTMHAAAAFLDGNNEWDVEIVYPGYNTSDPQLIISDHVALDPRLLVFTTLLQWGSPVLTLGPFFMLFFVSLAFCCCCSLCAVCCACICSCLMKRSSKEAKHKPASEFGSEGEPLLTRAAQDKEADRALPFCGPLAVCCGRTAGPPKDGPPAPKN